MTNAECTQKIIELAAIIESLQEVVLNMQKDVASHLKYHLKGEDHDRD